MEGEDAKVGQKLAPFNPSHEDVVAMALGMMRLQEGDVLYDLGCGDGRVLVRACESVVDIKATGVEYDLPVFERALKLVADSGLSHKIRVVHDNVLNVEFEDATAIFVYLLPEGMKLLKDKLCRCLANGARIVSYVFSIPGVEPAQVELYKSSTKVYLYKASA